MELNSKTNNRITNTKSAKTALFQKHKIFSYISIVFAFFVPLLLLLAIGFSVDSVLAQTYPLIASTRGSFSTADGSMVHQAGPPSALSILKTNSCPGALAIYVHGVWATEQQAEEQTQRVLLSLENSGYRVPVIGFSWDSNTTLDPSGWNIAKLIANQNGPKLAKFIADFKDRCPNDDLRIIAHSLGSRVALSSIQWLYDNDNERNNTVPKKIASVHLLGAAIDNEQVSMNAADCNFNNPPLPCTGKAIESEVGRFYNLYNPEDNMLQFAYRDTEGDDALGWCGSKGGPQNFFIKQSCVGEDPILTPTNYVEYSVTDNIKLDNDADKKDGCDITMKVFSDWQTCTIVLTGDNHMGYMGYRSGTNPQAVYDSGAMGYVAKDWTDRGG